MSLRYRQLNQCNLKELKQIKGIGGGTQIMPGEKDFFIKNKKVAKDRSRFKHW